ncbi:hypothetical protein JDV02_005120 [Purpureocillium takamizusanense]|uniref:Heterokaryon incompatibility domain-containing protein n=1 Tax=Purpureocillium takamizusanense TaxID=2060973 RepID=A0A9Q8QGL6_9HYPO|nr:uncharacterized protein JDV02_005120 [Purpureocillium takamizusanense]UNI18882.1 hypothetical protein JDV02_005120 [Purpureocillium takamizusanense]
MKKISQILTARKRPDSELEGGRSRSSSRSRSRSQTRSRSRGGGKDAVGGGGGGGAGGVGGAGGGGGFDATEVHQLPSRRGTPVSLARQKSGLLLAPARAMSTGRIIADADQHTDDLLDGNRLSDDHVDDDDNDDDNSSRRCSISRPRHQRRARQPPPYRVCPICAGISFPQLLAWQPGSPRPWIPLTHVLVPPPPLPPSPPASTDGRGGGASSSAGPSASPSPTAHEPPPPPPPHPRCPYCAFFQAMLLLDAAGGGTFTPYLRIRRAFERLGGVGERHPLAGEVLGEVMTRNKALPWGYIIRAAEDDGDVGDHAQLELYTSSGHDGLPPRIRGRTVTPLLDHRVPKCWLDYCRRHHADKPCCEPNDGPPVPGLRLVDCEDKRVVCVDDIDGDEPEYLTFSYASDEPDGPSVSSPDHYLPEKLPTLFDDAITLTTSLGFRYLWIDRFCLPEPELRNQRILHLDLLGDIFSRSSLTLIVTSGDESHDVDAGIPGVSIPRPQQLSIQTPAGIFTTTLLRPDIEIATSPWSARAWTYEQGLFARRRLVLTPSQAYFQCRALHCHESIALPLRLAPGVNLGRVFPPYAAPPRPAQLQDQIGAYMALEMPHNKDRLDGFRAVLREYARLLGLAVDSFCALPLFHPDAFVNVNVVSQTDRLAIGLGWTPERALTPAQSLIDGDLPEPGYALAHDAAFPSWTWLAWAPREEARRRSAASGSTAAATAASVQLTAFHFSLLGEASPIVDGACSAPGMEISVGFTDGAVLSWEIDGDAIGKRGESAAFLRVGTYCFDMTVRWRDSSNSFVLDDGGDDETVRLPGSIAATILSWVRASPPLPPPAPSSSPSSASSSTLPPYSPTPAADTHAHGHNHAHDHEQPQGHHALVAVLISGRNWKLPVSSTVAGPSSGSGSGGAATLLVCHHRDWDPAAPLVRLGAVGLAFGAFAPGSSRPSPSSSSSSSRHHPRRPADAVLRGVRPGQWGRATSSSSSVLDDGGKSAASAGGGSRRSSGTAATTAAGAGGETGEIELWRRELDLY